MYIQLNKCICMYIYIYIDRVCGRGEGGEGGEGEGGVGGRGGGGEGGRGEGGGGGEEGRRGGEGGVFGAPLPQTAQIHWRRRNFTAGPWGSFMGSHRGDPHDGNFAGWGVRGNPNRNL